MSCSQLQAVQGALPPAGTTPTSLGHWPPWSFRSQDGRVDHFPVCLSRTLPLSLFILCHFGGFWETPRSDARAPTAVSNRSLCSWDLKGLWVSLQEPG